ncbi:hypothetical protein KUTeg_006168 [Tegillarca granosa]|uniref:Uncharacterized protein n=1 Tax=Tegillarca granosa TaxID=220873 RepID=A0ABQ9FFS9_TEGGR|nr:hypothetical protein KUTeg_006168 [Tegillarca granosa]
MVPDDFIKKATYTPAFVHFSGKKKREIFNLYTLSDRKFDLFLKHKDFSSSFALSNKCSVVIPLATNVLLSLATCSLLSLKELFLYN